MKKVICFVILVLSVNLFARDYEFVRIGGVLEQEIGGEIVKGIYQGMGETAIVKGYPGHRAAKLASDGDVDGEVMRAFVFGNVYPSLIRVPTSYYSVKLVAYIKKGSGIVIKSKEDLAKYKVAIVRGIKVQAALAKDAKVVNEVANADQLIKMVSSGRVDVAITNTVTGRQVMKSLNISNVKASENILQEVKLFHYLHERNFDEVEMVNNKIIEMKENGQLEMLIENVEKRLIK